MSQTEPPTPTARAAQLIGALFDEQVTPLAEARRRAGAGPYFPLGKDPRASTYFVEPRLRTMAPADYALSGSTAEGLLDALAASWAAQGETELVALVPRLREIAGVLAQQRTQSDGTVDVLCYTLF